MLGAHKRMGDKTIPDLAQFGSLNWLGLCRGESRVTVQFSSLIIESGRQQVSLSSSEIVLMLEVLL